MRRCIYFGFRYDMDSCDAVIQSLRCELFASENFEYHYGTQ
eukprot:UN04619